MRPESKSLDLKLCGEVPMAQLGTFLMVCLENTFSLLFSRESSAIFRKLKMVKLTQYVEVY